MPEAALLQKHRLRCAQLPDRYAQATALQADVDESLLVMEDLRKTVAGKSIPQLARMDWTSSAVAEEGEDSQDEQ